MPSSAAVLTLITVSNLVPFDCLHEPFNPWVFEGRAAVGCGASPGMSNVMAVDAAAELDTVENIDLAWVVGDEPVVGFEFESKTAEEYAKPT